MATKAAPKKTTRKTTAPKRIAKTEAPKDETPVGHKACAYPSCSARGTKEFGDNKVPSCDVHAPIFETQADDGAGIQQLMESYKG